MTIATIAIVAVVLVAAIYVIGLYNGLIGLNNGVSKARANIDVLPKQRHDEIPKLVEICKRYVRHERRALEDVI